MELIEYKKMIEIMEKFQKNFIKDTIDNNKLLMWSKFVKKPILMPFDKIGTLNINENEQVYFF